MPIKRTLDRIPGGMIIPIFLGNHKHICSKAVRIGGFTEALFVNGVVPLIGFFLLCTGAEIN